MSYEPLIRDSNGSGDVAFRIPSTTEENYLAYQMGLYLADSANIPDALVTTNATNGTSIGSHSNTYYNAILGQHGFTTQDITTETVTLYQKNSILDESNADYRRPIKYILDDGQTQFIEHDSDDMSGLTNRLLSRAFTSDYPGTMKLATSTPAGGYTLVEEAFRDTRANDDSDVNIYNLYKRTSMSAPDTIRPFHIKRSGGRTGTYEGLQSLTDTQIKESFGARARHLISANNSSIGSYQLRTAIQGAPTDPGTWVAKGTASDTTNTATERNYTRNCQVTRFTNFTGTFIGNYIGTFIEILNYTGDFIRDFTGNFSGNFISDTGVYETNYAGNYVGDYIESYTGTFTQTFIGNYLRDYTGNFLGTDYTGDFVRDFTGNFVPNYTGNFINEDALAQQQNEPTGNTLPQQGNPLMTLTAETHSQQRLSWLANETKVTSPSREALMIPDRGLTARDQFYQTTGTTTYKDRNGCWVWPATGTYGGTPHSVLFSICAERESGGGAYVGCTIEFADDPRCDETFRVYFKADNADAGSGTYYYSISGAASGNINVNPGLFGNASAEVEFVPGAGNTVTFYNQVRRDAGSSVSMAFIIIMTGEEDTNSIEQDYTRLEEGADFSRLSAETFTGDYLGNFITNDYVGNYVGEQSFNAINQAQTYSGAYSFIGNFTDSIFTNNSVGNYVGAYTGNFLGAYLRNSLANFTTTYARIFTETYTTVSIVNRDSASFQREYIFETYLTAYQTTFTGTFIGDADYISDFTDVFTDNFTNTFSLINEEDTAILENYEGTFAGNFIGDFTGDFSALELTEPSQTINTYTLYVRVA
jgi:hypothetical protein